MENKNEKSQKENNKYVLLEKPMFFNSKLNKEANQPIEQSNNLNKINNNFIPISKNNKDKNININHNDNKTKIENNKDNIKKESPKNEMKFRCFKVDQMKQNGICVMAFRALLNQVEMKKMKNI